MWDDVWQGNVIASAFICPSVPEKPSFEMSCSVRTQFSLPYGRVGIVQVMQMDPALGGFNTPSMAPAVKKAFLPFSMRNKVGERTELCLTCLTCSKGACTKNMPLISTAAFVLV